MNRKFISVLVVLLLIAVAALARHQQHNIKTNNGNKVQLKTHRWYNPFAAPTTRDYLKDQDGNSIPLHNFMGTMYFADIKVGTPKQPFAVVLDTGSSTLWLPGIDCPIFGSNSCGFHPRYNRTQSTTYKVDPQGRKLHLEYGSGTSSGALVQEKLFFAGYETEVLMGEMDQVGLGAAYLIGKFDGLLGLGFMPLSPYNEIKMLPVMNLIEEGKLQQPYFQFYMSQEPDVDGEFVIGRIEPSHFENYDQVKWIPLQSKTYWDTKLVGISSNGKMLPLDVGRGVIDSGTSLIAASEAVLKVIAPIVGAKQFIIPQEYIFDDCSTTNKPDLTFHLGPNAEPFVLTPEMYIMRFSDDGLGAESLKTLRLQNRLHEVGEEEICLFSFLQMNMPPAMSDIVIIGDTFMKNYVVIHDPVEGKVGIGKAKL